MKKLGKAILGLVAAVAMLVTGLTAPLTAVADGDNTAGSGTSSTLQIKINKAIRCLWWVMVRWW
ncbi:hypothetical protein [Bifidobacterium simiiventris]|uniref:hypothetical protein n=1 Tax=Bifidobacterium simiiventris TaxID=2834434 RepID=UPI001C59D383|nr:hypothetical protein [Bifidobacterium simiiventris]MBW3079799.1 hypothetical protein [Bifidobacterium simiiventris]